MEPLVITWDRRRGPARQPVERLPDCRNVGIEHGTARSEFGQAAVEHLDPHEGDGERLRGVIDRGVAHIADRFFHGERRSPLDLPVHHPCQKRRARTKRSRERR
jgi:hypothetical protein